MKNTETQFIKGKDLRVGDEVSGPSGPQKIASLTPVKAGCITATIHPLGAKVWFYSHQTYRVVARSK